MLWTENRDIVELLTILCGKTVKGTLEKKYILDLG